MMHILICDDNELHLRETARVIQCEAAAHGEPLSLAVFASAGALLSAIQSQKASADIAILDISMEDMNGIALAKRINAVAPRCQIIFLTSYTDYVMDVYETNHVYYVLKSSLAERIWPAIEKARARFAALDTAFLTVSTSSGAKIFPYSEIRYFEHYGRKTRVRMERQDDWLQESLNQLMKMDLPARFLRCHQSFIVNLDYVLSLDGEGFTLRDDTRIPISRAHKKEAQDAFWRNLNASILGK